MKWTQRQIESHDDAHPFGCERPYCACRQPGGPNYQPESGMEEAEAEFAEYRERMAILPLLLATS